MNHKLKSPTVGLISKTIDWYFQFAPKRAGTAYELQAGGWLDRMFSLGKALDRIDRSEARNKATLALWGPSQTGKSMFLSRYIDGLADEQGNNSALDWGTPVRFSLPKHVPGVRILNPFNLKGDASGCISRFTLGDKATVDPDHPVQLRLVQSAQLLHALAAGYWTESAGADPKAVTVYWDAQRVTELLRRYQQQRLPIHRATYRLLHNVCDVLELLQRSFIPRYSKLRIGWKKLRETILQTSGLYGSRESVIEFAAHLLWDGAASFTRAFEEMNGLLQTLRNLAGVSGEPDLRCSFDVAAVLLDIASYANLVSTQPPEGKPAGIYEIGWRSGPDGGCCWRIAPARRCSRPMPNSDTYKVWCRKLSSRSGRTSSKRPPRNCTRC